MAGTPQKGCFVLLNTRAGEHRTPLGPFPSSSSFDHWVKWCWVSRLWTVLFLFVIKKYLVGNTLQGYKHSISHCTLACQFWHPLMVLATNNYNCGVGQIMIPCVSLPLRLYLGYALRGVAYAPQFMYWDNYLYCCELAAIYFILLVTKNQLLSLLILLLMLSQTCQPFSHLNWNHESICFMPKVKTNSSLLRQEAEQPLQFPCLCLQPLHPRSVHCNNLKRHTGQPAPEQQCAGFGGMFVGRGILRHHLGVPQTVGSAVIFQNENVSSLWRSATPPTCLWSKHLAGHPTRSHVFLITVFV